MVKPEGADQGGQLEVYARDGLGSGDSARRGVRSGEPTHLWRENRVVAVDSSGTIVSSVGEGR